ncbi:MAG: DUF177 domain-containing protein [Magnetococcales bacterium]|nr:DUF177 domain-containing protein [Magnetococcales bacterium]
METGYPMDFTDPFHSLTRGFRGEEPRDLSGVALELASLAHRSTPWTAHGIVPPASLVELGEAGTVEGPVELHVMATPIMRESRPRIRVLGRGWCRMRLACSRCLTEFPLDLEATIDACFAAGQDPAMKNKRWQIEEDVVFLPDGVLKMKHLVEEELLLTLPMNPLCMETCAGLCAGCGADLNQTPCACHKAKPSGPFAVLSQFYKV